MFTVSVQDNGKNMLMYKLNLSINTVLYTIHPLNVSTVCKSGMVFHMNSEHGTNTHVS